MSKAIVGIEAEDRRSRVLAEAMAKAIALTPVVEIPIVQVLSEGFSLPEKALFCPLTLNLPPNLDFPARAVYQACQAVSTVRRVVQGWGYEIGEGQNWLPIVFTAKGPLYAEAIALTPEQTYVQPFDLADRDRQSLYYLSYRLLKHLTATPGVYLLQFDVRQDRMAFDRLIPFPDLPALASVGIQSPDLFVCHWYCMVGEPVRDLTIVP